MEKQDILICDKMLELFNEMHFKELQGKYFLDKFIIFKNFAAMVSKYKNPKLEPVKKKKSLRKLKEGKNAKS